MTDDTLPSEWRIRRLRELHAGGVTNLNPADHSDEMFEYYSIPAYQEGMCPPIVQGREILSQKLLIPPRCLLFGKLNPRVEKVWKVESLGHLRCLASTEWLPIVPTDGLDQRFGYYLLWSNWVLPVAQGLVSGSTPSRQRVEPGSFYDVEVPLPPIDEQREIGSLLEQFQFAVLAQDVVIEAALNLKRAAMRELFTCGLRGEAQKETEIGPIPEIWDAVPLGSLGRVGNGSTPKKSVPEYWKSGTYPWLTSAKVYDREIVEADQFVTEQALRECHLPQIDPGAILIAITGQGKTLGHCAVLQMQATINQHIAYIAIDLCRADPSFVRGYLETKYDYFRQVGSGRGSTKGALTCAFLRAMPIPLPPTLDEQREIATILDAIDRKIDLHRKKRAVLDELFKALLHKLMTGEIRVDDLDLSALAEGTRGDGIPQQQRRPRERGDPGAGGTAIALSALDAPVRGHDGASA
jgi:type I restriction enzyme S subunit